ncbi:polyhydroxyalkanoic acid synthase [Halorhodospira halochloris]|uniref:Polyhydroxyalkanoic acid synthase n=1 Tax=Halorhodospira halochloris TaxID=1052 RepID=A0A0X8X8J1_HALHR|nr:alpha/beta fold hydrolase [Halorhodospira halochloris]MBK1652277.1 class III poly(R)-hydroxyalkanoic acid synthase subunit PhaC [Halorhodospira halochloris]BAU56928.1 polyhydroxyalkanoic acid synthase [Halorhodospira halochloris]
MIAPDQAQQEIQAWHQRLIRALEQAHEAQAKDTASAGASTPDQRITIGNRLQLRVFTPEQERSTPVLIIYSMVNRPSILDLTAQRSWLRPLLEAGHPVYLTDWQEPCGADRFLSLDDHLEHSIGGAAQCVRDRHAGHPPNILGICQGGTLALCLASTHAHLVNRIVNLVTPVDFHTPGDQLSRLVQQIDFERIINTLGNVSAHWLNAVFIALKPYRLLGQRYLDFPEIADNPQAVEDFVRLERWMYDSPNQPARALAQFATDFYQRNALTQGTLRLCGKTIELDKVSCPILNIYAEHDHLVPPAAAQALGKHIASANYQEICFAGGHLGVFISRRAQSELVPQALSWFAATRK